MDDKKLAAGFLKLARNCSPSDMPFHPYRWFGGSFDMSNVLFDMQISRPGKTMQSPAIAKVGRVARRALFHTELVPARHRHDVDGGGFFGTRCSAKAGAAGPLYV